MDDLSEELLNTPVVFGLVNQGHISTIENMLERGCNWQEIGSKIGWEPATAREYYEDYRQKKENADPTKADICAVLAKAIEYLRKLSPKLNQWDNIRVREIVYEAEKHLLSTPKKNYGPSSIK